MVSSLSDLCSRMNGTASLVLQGDRRQMPDRRRARRGGRRADDVNLAADELDMRSVAIRRTLAIAQLSSMAASDDAPRGDARYHVVTHPSDAAARRLATTSPRTRK